MKDVAAGVARYRAAADRMTAALKTRHPLLDPAEIESAVMLALYQSVVRYDEDRGSFQALFQQRAYGAVQDVLRAEDTLSRDDRDYFSRGETRPDGTTIVAPTVRSLDAPARRDDGGRPPDYHEAVGAEDPNLEALLDDGPRIEVEPLLAALNERQRLAINLCYWENLTQEEAAEIMGVTNQRVSQLCSRALDLMRRQLGLARKPRRLRPAAAPGKLPA